MNTMTIQGVLYNPPEGEYPRMVFREYVIPMANISHLVYERSQGAVSGPNVLTDRYLLYLKDSSWIELRHEEYHRAKELMVNCTPP